ncbi:protein-glutamate methylesterase/protein-glutamine glutaminase [Rhizobium leguminosarum]|uniref:Protein-glutamate methylesterase/protein-glutamine glutaminase n=1 Tax=Rhizobium leguminosarum TaxID=384 RepID=A0A1B1CBK3_RHILE|nr:chemotaxis response regulator protein-glutamate methylesterase [Rhizobium leguminosarum]ANP87119.1 chemotaxis response regulator protein-glutamate methylesterase [Rhizobium leguminosarum]
MAKKIRVLIIDDSASIRQTLTHVLEQDPDIEIMAVASDPFMAARKLQEEIPDVITLDVEMPRMDGITFLRKLMSQRPIPVDVILKSKIGAADSLSDDAMRIREVVKSASHARLSNVRRAAGTIRSVSVEGPAKKLTADVMLPPPTGRAMAKTTEMVVCVGASTGGTEALREFLEELPANAPGMVIVQHMPEKFTAAFAKRLNGLCEVEVKEAVDGDPVLRGHVLIAPGDKHMLLERQGARYYVSVKTGPLVSRHRPSVDVLFRSAARSAGSNAMGIIMTGMGDDGARGMLEMHQTGAYTVAQDEASSVVFGMPKEAIAIGGVDRVLPLDQIAREVLMTQQKF